MVFKFQSNNCHQLLSRCSLNVRYCSELYTIFVESSFNGGILRNSPQAAQLLLVRDRVGSLSDSKDEQQVGDEQVGTQVSDGVLRKRFKTTYPVALSHLATLMEVED